MMPRRRRTRAQNRAARIAIERRQSHEARTTRAAQRIGYTDVAAPPGTDHDPPPF